MIYETETPYQYARVVEDDLGKRTLELNEGQAFHSVYEPIGVLTGDYWDSLLVLPFLTRSAPPRSVAILGNAAGTATRLYEEYLPRTAIDGVEIDAELSEIGRRYFDMNNPNLRLHHEDARPFLRRIDKDYDVILVDAYRQPYIPFYLATREFFELCRDRLADGGTLVVNVGHPEGQDDLEKVLTATMGEVFPNVLRDPVEDSNTLLVTSESPMDREPAPPQHREIPERAEHAHRGNRVAARSAARGRRGLHRRQGSGRVADRQVDRRLRRERRRLTPSAPIVIARVRSLSPPAVLSPGGLECAVGSRSWSRWSSSLFVVACGDDDDDSDESEAAEASFEFSGGEITGPSSVDAGAVRVSFTNSTDEDAGVAIVRVEGDHTAEEAVKAGQAWGTAGSRCPSGSPSRAARARWPPASPSALSRS